MDVNAGVLGAYGYDILAVFRHYSPTEETPT